MKRLPTVLHPSIQNKLLLLAGWILFSFQNLNAQSLPLNIGFESGNLTGWSGFTGQCCPVYTPNNGTDPARHLITSGTATDTLSLGLITEVAPGSLHSARLGNAENLADGEALEYNFTVPSDSLILQIRFAVLLEDGLHPASKQPRFHYRVTSATGQLLPGCSEAEVLAGSPFPGKLKTGNLEILPWQTRSIPLSGWSGQTVSIRFETGDCGPGGHFGYAYIDCDIISSKITPETCWPDGSMSLQVSPGLNGVWFNGSTSDSILIPQPLPGVSYYYELNAGTNCNFFITPELPDSVLPSASFTFEQDCEASVTFQNLSSYQAGSLFNWDFGDSQVSNLIDPLHLYPTSGVYFTTLNVIQPNQCRSVFSLPVIIDEPAQPVIEKPDTVCLEQYVEMKIRSVIPVVSCSWTADSYSFSGSSFVFVPQNQGLIPITVTLTDSLGCEYFLSDEIWVDVCENEPDPVFIPSAFSPNHDGINDRFTPVIPDQATEIKLLVFNRFGQTICQSKEWDGRFSGLPAAQGVYAFRLTYILNGKLYFHNGTVTLVR